MFLTGLALLPAIALVVWIYRQDKVEKEPRGLLWKIFLFGVLSVIPAMILEIILDEVFLVFMVFMDADTLCYVILDNFIGVALIEELCKMKAAKWAAWKHPAFNYKFDAIVYCVTSALGFAAIENVLYCLDGDMGTAVTRALLSVPSHGHRWHDHGIFLRCGEGGRTCRRYKTQETLPETQRVHADDRTRYL